MNHIKLDRTRGTMADFARMKSVLACVSKETTRYVTTKALVEKEKEGIAVTATDGRRLRRDHFALEADPGIYDIKVNSGKSILLARSAEDLVYPDYRHAIPYDTVESAYSINGTGSRFVVWASAALGCYVDPRMVSLGEGETITLYIQKNNPNLSPALMKNDKTTLVVMSHRIDHQWGSEVEAVQMERIMASLEAKEAEGHAAV